MVASLLKLANLDWAVHDYTTLCRRQKTLGIQIPYRRAGGCIDPVKICSCYKGEGSDECDYGRQHQTVDGEA